MYYVYSSDHELIGTIAYAEDAAALVSVYSDGAYIQNYAKTNLWVEGYEVQPASESYDFVAKTIRARENPKGE